MMKDIGKIIADLTSTDAAPGDYTGEDGLLSCGQATAKKIGEDACAKIHKKYKNKLALTS